MRGGERQAHSRCARALRHPVRSAQAALAALAGGHAQQTPTLERCSPLVVVTTSITVRCLEWPSSTVPATLPARLPDTEPRPSVERA